LTQREDRRRTCSLDDVISTRGAPLNLAGIQLVGDRDGLAVDNELAVIHHNGARVLAVDGVILLNDVENSD